MPRKLTLALSSLALLLLLSAVAQADPVVVTGGTANTSLGIGNFSLNLTAPGFSFSGGDTSAPDTQLCGLCQPGTQFGGGAIPVQIDTILGLTYNGVTYGAQGFVVISSGNFITVPLLTVPADLSPIVSPFSFIGGLSVTPRDGSPSFHLELTGAGTATFTFTQSANNILSRGVFTFAPPQAVPEPATMLLLATGIGGLLAAKSRRAKR